jgi:hypothetical protein
MEACLHLNFEIVQHPVVQLDCAELLSRVDGHSCPTTQTLLHRVRLGWEPACKVQMRSHCPCFLFIIHLFACAYIVWVISPPAPLPHPLL